MKGNSTEKKRYPKIQLTNWPCWSPPTWLLSRRRFHRFQPCSFLVSFITSSHTKDPVVVCELHRLFVRCTGRYLEKMCCFAAWRRKQRGGIWICLGSLIILWKNPQLSNYLLIAKFKILMMMVWQHQILCVSRVRCVVLCNSLHCKAVQMYNIYCGVWIELNDSSKYSEQRYFKSTQQ